MKRKEISPVDRDIARHIKEDPEFAKAYNEELAKVPARLRRVMLRRLKDAAGEDSKAKK